jgi:hypothetical protein
VDQEISNKYPLLTETLISFPRIEKKLSEFQYKDTIFECELNGRRGHNTYEV